MVQEGDTVAFDFTEDVKNTALYFTWVLPLDPLLFFNVNNPNDEIKYYKELMPEVISCLTNERYRECFFDNKKHHDYLKLKSFFEAYGKTTDHREVILRFYIHIKEILRNYNLSDEKVYSILNSNYILPSIIDYKNQNNKKDFISYVYPSNLVINSPTMEYQCILTSLSQLKLIDTKKASWNHICEIRKDKKSINSIRRLKTFFHEIYAGNRNKK